MEALLTVAAAQRPLVTERRVGTPLSNGSEHAPEHITNEPQKRYTEREKSDTDATRISFRFRDLLEKVELYRRESDQRSQDLGWGEEMGHRGCGGRLGGPTDSSKVVKLRYISVTLDFLNKKE